MVRSGLTVHQRRIIEQKVVRCWVLDNGEELDGETEMGMERWERERRRKEKGVGEKGNEDTGTGSGHFIYRSALKLH